MGRDTVAEFDSKKLHNCRQVAQELVTTEDAYVQTLENLIVIAAPTLLKRRAVSQLTDRLACRYNATAATPESLDDMLSHLNLKGFRGTHLPPPLTGQLRELFKVIVPIYHFHKQFHAEIVDSVETLHLGEVVKHHWHFLRMYSDYCIHYQRLKESGGLKDWCNRNPKVRTACAKILARIDDDGLNKLGIDSLFDQVFQRFPRYKLLIERYEKNLLPVMPDKKHAKEALRLISEATSNTNEMVDRKIRLEMLTRITNPQKYLDVCTTEHGLPSDYQVRAFGYATTCHSESDLTKLSDMQRAGYYVWINDYIFKCKTKADSKLITIQSSQKLKSQPSSQNNSSSMKSTCSSMGESRKSGNLTYLKFELENGEWLNICPDKSKKQTDMKSWMQNTVDRQ